MMNDRQPATTEVPDDLRARRIRGQLVAPYARTACVRCGSMRTKTVGGPRRHGAIVKRYHQCLVCGRNFPSHQTAAEYAAAAGEPPHNETPETPPADPDGTGGEGEGETPDPPAKRPAVQARRPRKLSKGGK